jgi:hypothetical protein
LVLTLFDDSVTSTAQFYVEWLDDCVSDESEMTRSEASMAVAYLMCYQPVKETTKNSQSGQPVSRPIRIETGVKTATQGCWKCIGGQSDGSSPGFAHISTFLRALKLVGTR